MRTPQLHLHQEDIPPSISRHFPSHPSALCNKRGAPSPQPELEAWHPREDVHQSLRTLQSGTTPSKPMGLCLSHWSRITDGSERARLGRVGTGTLFSVLLPTRRGITGPGWHEWLRAEPQPCWISCRGELAGIQQRNAPGNETPDLGSCVTALSQHRSDARATTSAPDPQERHTLCPRSAPEPAGYSQGDTSLGGPCDRDSSHRQTNRGLSAGTNHPVPGQHCWSLLV